MTKIIALCLVALAVSVTAELQEIKAPYHVSIIREGVGHVCSGAILNPGLVLTAAHCVQGYEANQIRVAVASDQMANERNLMAVHIFPSFNNETLDYDIAMLQVEMPIEFNHTIQSIAIASEVTQGDVKALLTGFGLKNENSERITNELEGVNVKTLSAEECSHKVPTPEDEHKLCIVPEEHAELCRANSGEPLVAEVNGRLELIGIMSSGAPGCSALEESPYVASRVSYYIKWIHVFFGGARGRTRRP